MLSRFLSINIEQILTLYAIVSALAKKSLKLQLCLFLLLGLYCHARLRYVAPVYRPWKMVGSNNEQGKFQKRATFAPVPNVIH